MYKLFNTKGNQTLKRKQNDDCNKYDETLLNNIPHQPPDREIECLEKEEKDRQRERSAFSR